MSYLPADKLPANTAPTSSAVGVTTVKERIQRVVFGDLSGTTATVVVTGLPANIIILDAFIELVTPFTGGGLTVVAAGLGQTNFLANMSAPVDIFGGLPAGVYRLPTNTTLPITQVTADVRATIISTVTNLNLATAGNLYIHVVYTTFTAGTP